MKKGEIIREAFLMIIFILVIISFQKFIFQNAKLFLLPFCFFFIVYGIIFFHERKYSKTNFPYKPYKIKKRLGERILLGFLAGFHYFFFIGTYNHKKYNTQIWYPETLECFFGNLSLMIIFFAYLFISITLFKVNLWFSLLFMVIPIITTLISLKIKK